MAWLLFFALCAGCADHAPPESPVAPVRASGGGTPAAVVDTARSLVGAPYKWGGHSPDRGFDCSGLVTYVFARHGVALPRVSWNRPGWAGRSLCPSCGPRTWSSTG